MIFPLDVMLCLKFKLYDCRLVFLQSNACLLVFFQSLRIDACLLVFLQIASASRPFHLAKLIHTDTVLNMKKTKFPSTGV